MKNERDPVTKHFEVEFVHKYRNDIVSLIRHRGVNSSVPMDPELAKVHNRLFNDALAEACVWINGIANERSVTDVLRMDLERRARVEAFENGYNSTLVGEEDD